MPLGILYYAWTIAFVFPLFELLWLCVFFFTDYLLSFSLYVLSLNYIHIRHGFVWSGSLLIQWRSNTLLGRQCLSLQLTGRLSFQILVGNTGCHLGVTSNKECRMQRLGNQPPQCVTLWRAVLPPSGFYIRTEMCPGKCEACMEDMVGITTSKLTVLSY